MKLETLKKLRGMNQMAMKELREFRDSHNPLTWVARVCLNDEIDRLNAIDTELTVLIVAAQKEGKTGED